MMKKKYINMLKGSIFWLNNHKGVQSTTVLWLVVVFMVTPYLAKIFTMKNMVILAEVLYKFINISYVFMVLPMTWAEDRTMSTQVELQLDEMVLAFMFKKRSKHPSIKRLKNTNSFCWWSVSAQLGGSNNQFVFF